MSTPEERKGWLDEVRSDRAGTIPSATMKFPH